MYRSEALVASAEEEIAGLSATVPSRYWTTLAVGAVTLGALAMLAAGLDMSRRVSVSGKLVPESGIVEIDAPVDGRVASVAVEEGQQVQAGDLLLVIEAGRSQISVEGIAELLAENRRRIANEQAATRVALQRLELEERTLLSRRDSADSQAEQLRKEIRLQSKKVAAARALLEQIDRLRSSHHVSELQLRTQEERVLEHEAGLLRLHREAAHWTSESRLAALAIEDLPLRRLALQSDSTERIARLQEARISTAQLSARELRAPTAGTVSLGALASGTALSAGNTVVQILPSHSTLQAELRVPSKAIGFVAPGDAVRLRYQAFPFQKFGHQRGQVSEVSRAPVPGASGSTVDPEYRVFVTLEAQAVRIPDGAQQLKPGMLLEADLILEQRTVAEWIFEPVLAAYRRQGTQG